MLAPAPWPEAGVRAGASGARDGHRGARQRGGHAGVSVVRVVPQLEPALVVDERGPVEEVHGQRTRDGDDARRAARHGTLEGLGPAGRLAGQDERGQLTGLLHAHAAVAQRPVGALEELRQRRVVEVDVEAIRRGEAHPAQRVPAAGALLEPEGESLRADRRPVDREPVRVLAPVEDDDVVVGEESGVRAELRQELVDDDARGDRPRRVEHDRAQLGAHHRGGVELVADDHARREPHPPVLDDGEGCVRRVDGEVAGLEAPREPPPALQVDGDLADARIGRAGAPARSAVA